MDPDKVQLKQKGFLIKDLLPPQKHFPQPHKPSDSKTDSVPDTTYGFKNEGSTPVLNLSALAWDVRKPTLQNAFANPLAKTNSDELRGPSKISVTSSSLTESDGSDDNSEDATTSSSSETAKKVQIQKPIPEHPRLVFNPGFVRLPVAYPIIPASFAQCGAHLGGRLAFRCPCNSGNCPSAFTRLSQNSGTFKGLFSGDQLFDVKDQVPVPVPLPFYVRMRDSLSCDGCVKTKRCRRSRTVFSELQLMGLERRFDTQKYLSTPDRVTLAESLGLTQIQVKTWYQNRRMKWKKQVLQNGGTEPPTKPKGRPRKITLEPGSDTADVSIVRDDVTRNDVTRNSDN